MLIARKLVLRYLLVADIWRVPYDHIDIRYLLRQEVGVSDVCIQRDSDAVFGKPGFTYIYLFFVDVVSIDIIQQGFSEIKSIPLGRIPEASDDFNDKFSFTARRLQNLDG